MKHCTLLLCLFLQAAIALAQPVARFIDVRHEFGSITWQKAAVANFVVTNVGNTPLLINDVHPDCGCTVVNWPKKAIAPGDSATICATYNAELLGSFQKAIAVHTNAATTPTYLVLSGEVVLQKEEYTGDFPCQIGEIFLSHDNLEFDDVHSGTYPEKTILIYNNGKKPYRPELMHLPKYLLAFYEPAMLASGRAGRIIVRLDTDLLREKGLTQTNVYLSRFPGDRVKKDNDINVSVTLLPEIKKTKAELLYAPVAHLDTTVLNLGTMGGKKKVKAYVTLTNKGLSNLEIQALQVYNPGLEASIKKSVLKPGESQKLKITVHDNSDYFKGRRRVLLITNDPREPKHVIDIIIKK